LPRKKRKTLGVHFLPHPVQPRMSAYNERHVTVWPEASDVIVVFIIIVIIIISSKNNQLCGASVIAQRLFSSPCDVHKITTLQTMTSYTGWLLIARTALSIRWDNVGNFGKSTQFSDLLNKCKRKQTTLKYRPICRAESTFLFANYWYGQLSLSGKKFL